MQSSIEKLVEAFNSRTLPKQEWTHHAHLKVGLWYLLHYSPNESLARLRRGIKQYNVACGVENTETQGYHETITRFYIGIIFKFLQQTERSQSIDRLADELINNYGDKSLPLEYYSRDKLFSTEARLCWVKPDLKPFNEF